MKLYKLIEGKFILQDDNEDDGDGGDEDEEEEHNGMDADESPTNDGDTTFTPNDDEEWEGFSDDENNYIQAQPSGGSVLAIMTPCSSEIPPNNHTEQNLTDSATIIANKRTDLFFAKMHHSKSILWFTTRPIWMGGRSSAGAIPTVSGEQPWFFELPEDNWNHNQEV